MNFQPPVYYQLYRIRKNYTVKSDFSDLYKSKSHPVYKKPCTERFWQYTEINMATRQKYFHFEFLARFQEYFVYLNENVLDIFKNLFFDT